MMILRKIMLIILIKKIVNYKDLLINDFSLANGTKDDVTFFHTNVILWLWWSWWSRWSWLSFWWSWGWWSTWTRIFSGLLFSLQHGERIATMCCITTTGHGLLSQVKIIISLFKFDLQQSINHSVFPNITGLQDQVLDCCHRWWWWKYKNIIDV